jgi:hypothetical protein
LAEPRKSRWPEWGTRVVGAILLASTVTWLHFFALRRELPGGEWSLPVDDTYIHLQYARSIVEGHPFTYHRGDGYSTGSTSPLYAMFLAPFVAVGFTGERAVPLTLVLGGVFLALTFLLLLRLGRQLGNPTAGRVAAAVFCTWGFVWFCFFGGMETGFYITLLLACLSSFITWSRQSDPRPRVTMVLLAGALPLVRPEGVFLLAVLLGVVLWRLLQRGTRGAWLRWAIALAPVALYYLCNLLLTGRLSTAGMVSKSILHAPYLDGVEKTLRFLGNLFDAIKLFLAGGDPQYLSLLLALPGVAALCTLAFHERARRSLGPYLILVGWMFVALLSASMHMIKIAQWTRYYLPAFALVLLGTGFAISWLAQGLRRRWIAAGTVAALLLFQSGQTFHWMELYQRDLSVIFRKQAAAGRAVQRLPESARVLVCDAGAVPWFSRRRTFDIVGLTSPLRYNDFRNGVGSRFELFERLPPSRRPDYVAAYDFCLWPGARGAPIGVFVDMVVAPIIERGAGTGERPATPLPASAQVVDKLDVADLESEAGHRYGQTPEATIAENLLRRAHVGSSTTVITDGGRLVRARESFRLRGRPGQPATLIVRSHQDRPGRLQIRFGGEVLALQLPRTPPDEFTETSVPLPTHAVHERNTVEVRTDGGYAAYHYFLVQGR